MRVFFAYDDPEFAIACRDVLESEGFQVEVFQTSLEAWERLGDASQPDLLITRIRFPGEQPHGVALARMALSKWPDLKVLLLALPEVAEHAEGIGPVLHLPASPEEVVEAVRRSAEGALNRQNG